MDKLKQECESRVKGFTNVTGLNLKCDLCFAIFPEARAHSYFWSVFKTIV